MYNNIKFINNIYIYNCGLQKGLQYKITNDLNKNVIQKWMN